MIASGKFSNVLSHSSEGVKAIWPTPPSTFGCTRNLYRSFSVFPQSSTLEPLINLPATTCEAVRVRVASYRNELD